MTAFVNVLPVYNLKMIAEGAGQTNGDKFYYGDEKLYVEDVEQSALDAALASYLLVHDSIYLTQIKDAAKQDIDNTAERIRLKYITGGAGQALVYNEKGEEAADYIAAGSPVDLANYPFIQAEVNATGKSATQCANDILAQKAAWITKGAQIEQVRIGAKTTIDLATSIVEVELEKVTALSELSSL